LSTSKAVAVIDVRNNLHSECDGRLRIFKKNNSEVKVIDVFEVLISCIEQFVVGGDFIAYTRRVPKLPDK